MNSFSTAEGDILHVPSGSFRQGSGHCPRQSRPREDQAKRRRQVRQWCHPEARHLSQAALMVRRREL